eukprot:TRINITY_DN43217_c0_g1_i1.p1 TRINITY_DN43217_c0_g1~~TRINITY_DN43217_c0_g1_i1.p1  ORF type:complete len:601 (+),score=160.29 TRINITY_DN43217_c0_g1_i1:63-1805(+)
MASACDPATEFEPVLARWSSPELHCAIREYAAQALDPRIEQAVRQEDGGARVAVAAAELIPVLRWAAATADPDADSDLSDGFVREQFSEFYGARKPAFDPDTVAEFALHCVRSRWLLQTTAKRLPRADAALRRALPEAAGRLRGTLLYARALATQLTEMPAEVSAEATVGAIVAQKLGLLPEPLTRSLLELVPSAEPCGGDQARWSFPHPSLAAHLMRQAAADVVRGDPYSLEPFLAGLIAGESPQIVVEARRLAGTAGLRHCLHRAARLGAPAILLACIADGADPNARNDFQQTALHVAGSAAAVHHLCPDNLEARDVIGRTPLMQAAADGLAEVVDALLTRGADAEARSEQGVTALMLAAQGPEEGRPSLLCADHSDCVGIMVRHGVSLNSVGPQGMTALCYATLQGQAEQVKELLRGGADPRIGNAENVTPLHFSAFRGDAQLARELIAHGANPNASDVMGRTPKELSLACGNEGSGHSEIRAVMEAQQPFALGQGSIKSPADVYRVGTIVEVHSLKSMTGRCMNGKHGTVTGPHGDRVRVVLPELGERAVRPEHLRVVEGGVGGGDGTAMDEDAEA